MKPKTIAQYEPNDATANQRPFALYLITEKTEPDNPIDWTSTVAKLQHLQASEDSKPLWIVGRHVENKLKRGFTIAAKVETMNIEDAIKAADIMAREITTKYPDKYFEIRGIEKNYARVCYTGAGPKKTLRKSLQALREQIRTHITSNTPPLKVVWDAEEKSVSLILQGNKNTSPDMVIAFEYWGKKYHPGKKIVQQDQQSLMTWETLATWREQRLRDSASRAPTKPNKPRI